MTLASNVASPGDKVEHPEGGAAQRLGGVVRHEARQQALGEPHVQAPQRNPDAEHGNAVGERKGEVGDDQQSKSAGQ